jgi:chlorite dismutase
MDRRDAPATEEGWYALHDLRSVDWDAWRAAPDREREAAIEEGIDYLASHEALEDADAGASATFAVMGHEADLMVVHLRPTTAHLDRAERAFEQTALAGFTERATSYVSVTEISGYVSDALEDGIENVEDAGTRNYLEQRIYPSIPDSEHVCFYPMDKRRGPDHNWYDLPFEERAELMSGHGEIGREYAGRVSQIITGSVGLDDHEWGVTLFADDPTDIKELLYEMRFDPSSSRYAEFGPFYFGRRMAPEDLPALLAGEPIPSDESGAARAEADRQEASPQAQGGEGTSDARDDGHPRGETASGNGETASGNGETAGEEAHDSGGRPAVAQGEPPHEETSPEDLERELRQVDVRPGDNLEARYGLVFFANADATDLVDDVEGLRSNFDHYDTHVATEVRATGGRSVVVSLWKNQRAADTASGFLGDLDGVTDGVGAPLPDAAETGGRGDEVDRGDEREEEPDGGSASGARGASSDGSDGGVSTADHGDLREELQDLGVYSGQPHGEDVYAMVLYSEADPDELADELGSLRERFEHYDSHVKSAVYENEAGDGRAGVVSLWETQDAASKAGGFLADLPGVVARAEKESGFGTMGMFYTVKPDYRDEFVERFETVGGMLAETDGHLETDLLVNREDENDMFIASQWRSKEDAMGFFRSDAFRDTVDWGRDVLADRPRHVFLA